MKSLYTLALEYGEAILLAYKRLRGLTHRLPGRHLNPGEENLLGVPYGALIDDVVGDILGRVQIEDFDVYTRTHRFYQCPTGLPCVPVRIAHVYARLSKFLRPLARTRC